MRFHATVRHMRDLFGLTGSQSPRRRHYRRHCVESLEERQVMSALSIVNGVATYSASPNVVNNLSIQYNAATNRYTIDDIEAIHLGPGVCLGLGNHTPRVSFSAMCVDSIIANLGNLNDRVTHYSGVDLLTVNAGDGNDVVDILGTSQPVTLNLGNGNDKVDVGAVHEVYDFGDLDAVLSSVTIHGQGGIDDAWVSDFDYPDVTPHSYTVTNAAISRNGGPSVFYDNTVENARLNAGCGSDSVHVPSTSLFTALTVSLKAGGADTVYVGSAANSLDTILGPLTVLGEQGAAGPVDHLVLNDRGDATVNNYTLREESFHRAGAARIDFRNMASVRLQAGLANDVINVEATGTGLTSTRVTVHAGTGNDAIRVGRQGSVAAIRGRLVIDGQAGIDSVFINDGANGRDVFVVTPGTVMRNGVVLLAHVGVEAFAILP